MAGSVNKVILIGNLGKDPEVRRLESGVTVASFPLATSESYKDRNSGERITKTEWHNIVLWRGLAEVAEKYLKKGNPVYIEGKLQTRSWEDQDKNMRYITEIVADQMTMLGSRSDNNNGAENTGYNTPAQSNVQQNSSNSGSTSSQQADFSSGDDEDDLPF